MPYDRGSEKRVLKLGNLCTDLLKRLLLAKEIVG